MHQLIMFINILIKIASITLLNDSVYRKFDWTSIYSELDLNAVWKSKLKSSDSNE